MRVSLVATCVVDILWPEVAVSTVRLLRRLGCQVSFPEGQTCCGQPAFNAGYREEAARVAACTLEALSGSEDEYVVTPSGSCAAMIRTVWPTLFADQPERQAAARRLAGRTYELSEFLVKVLRVDLRALGARFPATVAYHHSCHMTRELGVRSEPLILLDQIEGLRRRPLERADLCCGFGGTFSVKMPEVAEAMADDKLADFEATGAEYLVGADAACLIHLQGRLRRLGKTARVMHLAELLEQATRPGNASGSAYDKRPASSADPVKGGAR